MMYFDLFRNVKDNLVESGAEILFDESELALTSNERAYYKQEEDYFLHDDWFELFSSLNGINLQWQIHDAGAELSGFFLITDFLDFYDRSTENKLWVDWYEEDDIQEMKKHKILEVLHGNDAYITVKFEDDGTYNLYFVDGDSVNYGGSKELPKLPLNLKEYIQVVTDYFGVYSLRYHLHKDDFYIDPKKYIPEYDLLKKHVKNFNSSHNKNGS